MRGRKNIRFLIIVLFGIFASVLTTSNIRSNAAATHVTNPTSGTTYHNGYNHDNSLIAYFDAQPNDKSGSYTGSYYAKQSSKGGKYWINKVDGNYAYIWDGESNHIDEFGYHIVNTSDTDLSPCVVDLSSAEGLLDKVNNDNANGTTGSYDFTVELVMREFESVSETHDILFSMIDGTRASDKNVKNDEFVIYYQGKDDTTNNTKGGRIYVKYPMVTQAPASRPSYEISVEELQNSLITVTFSHTTQTVGIYVNGKSTPDSVKTSTGNVRAAFEKIRLGAYEFKGRRMKGTYANIRIYNKALTEDEINENFESDKTFYFCNNSNNANATPSIRSDKDVLYGLEMFNNDTNIVPEWEKSDWIIETKSSTPPSTSSNDYLRLENQSVYIKNKFKCGSGKYIVGEEQTHLMATADIQLHTATNVDFCGMVIDYSDKIYSLLDARRESLYFDLDENASPFSTGVGFNLRIENEKLYMRVFISGNGYDKKTKYSDIQIDDNPQGNHKYSIYRTYENWPYADQVTYDDNNTICLTNAAPTYVVRFYVDGNLKAVIGMRLDDVNKDSNYRSLKYRGAFYTVSKNEGGDETLQLIPGTGDGSLCTFGDWSQKNWYGENGSYSNADTDGDISTYSNIGTPSGNILIGFHTKANNDAKAYVDNIGYMDYKDAAYSASLEVTKDMSVHFDTASNYPEDMFPKIYFNRLGYTSSDETYSSIGAAEKNSETSKTNMHYDYKKLYEEKANGVDFKAAHGVSETAPKTEGGFIATVDGVFFRDIADTITYDVVDHNGIVIKTIKFNLLTHYLIPLYKGDIGNLDEKQKNFIVDLIELGRQESIYTGYDQINPTLKELSFEDKLPDCSRTLLENIEKPNLSNPKVKKQEGITSFENSFKSYNLVLKSYVALTVSIKLGSEKDLKKCLNVYRGTDENDENKIDFSEHNAKYSLLSIKTEDGVATIEIPVSILDYGTQYRFVLTDEAGKRQTLDYSVNQYCYAKWETTKNGINNYVKRLYHVGLLAKEYNQV